MADRKREKSRAPAGEEGGAGPKESSRAAKSNLPTPPWQLFSDLCEDHGIAAETAWALALAANSVDHVGYNQSMRHPGLIFQAALDHGDSPRSSWQEAMAYQGYEPHVAWDLLRLHGETVEYPQEDHDEGERDERGSARGKRDRKEATSRKRQLPKQGGRTPDKAAHRHPPWTQGREGAPFPIPGTGPKGTSRHCSSS